MTLDGLEAERRRLSAQLDGPLTAALNLLLAQSVAYEQAFAHTPQAAVAFAVISSLARQCQQTLRDVQSELNPPLLDAQGLEAALEAYIAYFQRTSLIAVTFIARRLPSRLPAPLEQALYRAAQALIQDAHHRRAHRIEVSLTRRDQPQPSLTLTVDDNGIPRRTLLELSQFAPLLALFGAELQQLNTSTLLHAPYLSTLPTEREREVLALLAEGLSSKAMAIKLGLSQRTVKFHLENLYSKLGVSSRAAALMAALRLGWLG